VLRVREQQADDYEAIRHVYAEAFRRPRFRRPQNPGSIPPEVGLFEALWEAGDAIPEFSFTALTDGGCRPRYGEPGDRRRRLSCCRRADWRPSGPSGHRHRERPDRRASRRC
jgi:hypothetical protein